MQWENTISARTNTTSTTKATTIDTTYHRSWSGSINTRFSFADAFKLMRTRSGGSKIMIEIQLVVISAKATAGVVIGIIGM